MSEDKSLLEYLDLLQVNCLNESESHNLKSILSSKSKNTSESDFLQSDADEQLLLNITFNQTVRVRSIAFTSRSKENAPKLVKLFVNRPAIGFDDVEDATEPDATQILKLSGDDVNGALQPLRYVRFQTVNSLHIFVASNQGDEEETRIDALDIFGIPVETTKDLSGLRQQEE